MQAILLALLVVGGVALQVLLSFRKMLDSDVAPWWSLLVGRRRTTKLFEYLVYRIMSWPSLKEVHVQAKKEKAEEKAKELKALYPADGAAKGGVLFFGGSAFAYGELKEQVAASLGVPVVNAAYAGTLTDIVHESIDQLALRHKPSVLVYSCGDHDLFCGRKPEEVAESIRTSHASLRSKLPAARVLLLALPTTPLHRAMEQEEAVKEINRLVNETVVQGDGGRSVIVEFDPTAEAPPEDVYLTDDHHLSAAGRKLLLDAVLPALKEQLASAGVRNGKKS